MRFVLLGALSLNAMRRRSYSTAGAILNDTFEIVGCIGYGGMGEVLEARHLRLGGRFAIKFLHPQANGDSASVDRLRREGEIGSLMTHPNLVRIVDFNHAPDGSPYLVMEYLVGRDLGAEIAAGRIELSRAMSIVRQLGSAVAALHRAGVIHCDLKPQNVFITELDGGGVFVKLLDFGVAVLEGTPPVPSSEVIGSPRYMSPEQVTAKKVDQKSDQFALATIVYEMLTGRPAFDAASVASSLYAIVHKVPPGIERLPHTVRLALSKALAKAPAERFSSVLEFVDALEG